MPDDDLHARLTAALQARLEVARAATPGPWRWDYIGLHMDEVIAHLAAGEGIEVGDG